MSKYPSRQEVRQLFSHLENGQIPEFMARVSKNVDWTVMGTSPMSERFRTLESFQNATLNRLGKTLQEPLRFEVKHIIGGGDQEWASVEMRAAPVKCKSGRDYDMTYAWQCRFDGEGMIVQVRAYIDTLLLSEVLQEHEVPKFHAPRDVY